MRSISEFSFHADQELVDTGSRMRSSKKKKCQEQSDGEGVVLGRRGGGGHLVPSLCQIMNAPLELPPGEPRRQRHVLFGNTFKKKVLAGKSNENLLLHQLSRRVSRAPT